MPDHLPADDILTLAMLEERGVGAGRRRFLVESGQLIRVRNGWFASPAADKQRVRAVRVGGRVTCMTALQQQGLWVMPDRRLHIAVPKNASRLRCPDHRGNPWDPTAHRDIRLHWTEPGTDPVAEVATDSVTASITHLLRCVSRNTAVVTIDSALNTKIDGRPVLAMWQLRDIVGSLSPSHRQILDIVDPTAQSGLETLARLNLRARRIRVRTQAQIDRVGRVDVLVGDRLVLELDGKRHHVGDNYESDRARDLELFRQGFTVIRVSYRRVMFDWPSVDEAILMAVRRGDHLRRARDARLGLLGTTRGRE